MLEHFGVNFAILVIGLESLDNEVIRVGLGHFVSPGHQSMLEHFGVNFAILVIGLESLNNEVIRVIAITSHLLLEHLDHVVIGACTSDLSKKSIKFIFTH